MRIIILSAFLVFNLIQGRDAWIGKINNSTTTWGQNRNQSVGWLPPTSGGQGPAYPGQPQPLYPPPPQHPTLRPQYPPYTTTQRPYYPTPTHARPSPIPLKPNNTSPGVTPQFPPHQGGVTPQFPPNQGGVTPQFPPHQGGVTPQLPPNQGGVTPQLPPSGGGVIPIVPGIGGTTRRPPYPNQGQWNDFTRLTYDVPGGNTNNKPNNTNVLNQLHRFKRSSLKLKPIEKFPNTKYQKCLIPDGEKGFCKHLKHCKIPKIEQDFLLILDHLCIIERSFIGVCCPDELAKPDIENKIIGPKIATFNSNDRGCGLPSQQYGKISNGKPSKPGQWPWMAALISNRQQKLFCGGTLITDRHILTAAHCISNRKPHDFRVRLGEYDFSQTDENQARDFSVLEVRLHIDFDPNTYENDIAIIKLQRPTLFNAYVWPICMPPIDTNWENHTGVVIGWGTLFYGGPTVKRLMEVEVPIWKNSVCQNQFSQKIFNTVLCAGTVKGGKDSCQGHSGSPLMVQLPNKRWVVAGVVSWGVKCAEPYPGVYTRVNKYVKWIIDNSMF